MARCAIVLDPGQPCDGDVEPDAPLSLCDHHLLVAHEWVTRDVGVTDVLPSRALPAGRDLG